MPRRRPDHPFDPISDALGKMASELSRAHFSQFYAPTGWKPHLNAYLCGDAVEICVDLAGVDRDKITLSIQDGRLVLQGQRPTPEPPGNAGPCQRILAMEIENGTFERSLELPEAVDASAISARQENGLLWIRLPLRPKKP